VLTGLPNRQYFASRLETTLHLGVTVCHLDLDGFATLTRGLGRQAGDSVLMHVAQRLQAAVAAERTLVARFGADEFAVLMPLTQPEMIVRHLREALRPPIDVGGHEIVVTAAIGVVSTTGGSPVDVLDAAELALARARGLGPGRWSLFGPADRERASAAAVLPSALRAGQVTVTYQPLHRLPSKQQVGVDAVLAWGGLSHWDCVRNAENWLLRKVCATGPALPVHVGVHTADPGEISRITAETGRPVDRLLLSVPADDRLPPLAGTGVGIEIRDFGLADIAFLETLPIRAVRLDRRLRQPGALTAKALRHVLAVVRAAGTSVIVDDLPTWSEAERWQDLGADIVAVGRAPGH
jgi:diguanylate cyclase (GGDEF)-like protein